MLEIIQETVQFLKKSTGIRPDTAIILGTGLSKITGEMEVQQRIPYASIPHFPVSTVQGHPGELWFGSIAGRSVMVMQGRIHYYETGSMSEVIYPVRVMKFFGIKNLILSNASGGLNPAFNTGDIMIITDHINQMPNPLIGPHDAAFGERFPDMSATYDPVFIQQFLRIGDEEGISLRKGCYVGVTGPSLETPKEYACFKGMGGDAVGMSTVPEAIVAHQMGMRCLALSVITDLGVEGKIKYTTHKDVLQVAEAVEPLLSKLVKKFLEQLS